MTDRPFRALDLTTSLAGAYCSRLLSAGGIDVTRAEPPTGHPLRRWSASGAAIAAGRNAPMFEWLAGGQESITVDAADAAHVDALLAHAGAFDLVLWAPEAAVTVDQLTVAAPGATVVALTPFGRHGPWAGRAATEFTLQALSGGPMYRGSTAWPPMTAGGQHGEYMLGVFGATAAMVALRRAVTTGGGGVIDVSGLEAVIMTQIFNPHTMETQAGGVPTRRRQATVGDVVRSADGYVGFAVVNKLQHWWDFCAMVDHPEWADDRGLDPAPARSNRADELNPEIEAWCAERTTAEIVELATLLRIPCIEVGHGASIPRMEHFAVERFHDVNPTGGFLQPAPPFRMHPPIPGVADVHPAPAPAPPPITTRPRVDAPPRRPATPGGIAPPFAGLRVADFTTFWAGPFLCHTLGMFGADVIHVESTSRPDGARLMNHHPRTTPQWWERSPFFHATNTNKRGVTVDLGHDEGRALARRLIAESDVLVENYSPRVMESFGLSYDEVRAIRPDIVMVRMPAFGLTGPWRDRTGFAMTMEQVSGMAWLTGFPEHDPGALFGPCDPSSGLHAFIALCVALEHRRRTGEGRLVECPMVAGALNVAGEQVIEHSAHGVRLDRTGNRGPAAAPQNCYATADPLDGQGQQRWVALAVATDEQWAALRHALGDPAWAAEPALATMAGRHLHHDAIDARLAAWCAERTADEVVATLWPAGVPVAPAVNPIEHLAFDQLRARAFFEDVEHPVHGSSVHSTYPFRLPGHEGPVHRRPAPTLGQHNREVFVDLLGLSDAELAALEATGVVGTALDDR